METSCPSTSFTILPISSPLMVPPRSLSKALKASQSTGMQVARCWSIAAARNSCTLMVPEPSRSTCANSAAKSFSSLTSRFFFRPLTTSSTVSTPSPFLSRHRKAFSTACSVLLSLGTCSATTRSTKRLNSLSCTFTRKLLSNCTMRRRGKVVRATFTQGCLRMAVAETRIAGLIRSICSTISRALEESWLQAASSYVMAFCSTHAFKADLEDA
mmetsp:Transcript_57919/g.135569  ORF Transcript_57919/g.135569 Transcript_57919/m.135569 type:complete len:214 (+) Transcript_57919:343-984(+)